MFRRFFKLELKEFFRSASFGKGLAMKILMAFFAVYFMVTFLILGLGLYPLLKKIYPEQDPFIIVNSFVFYWIIADLMMRFFFQKLPVMSVKPLLHLPIARSKVVHYVLGKSAISFFNILPFFATIPFGIILLIKGYDTGQVLIWILTIALITLIVNFLNFIIESFSAKSEFSFLPTKLKNHGMSLYCGFG